MKEAKRFQDAVREISPDSLPIREGKLGRAVRHPTDEAKFINRILEEPKNNARYFEYADWLEELGEPYGAFIRVCIGIENAKSVFPEADYLCQLQIDLLEAFSEGWLRPLAELGFKPVLMQYHLPGMWFNDKGVISSFTLNRKDVFPKQADRFFAALPFLQELHIHEQFVDLGVMSQHPRMADIVSINKFTTSVTEIHALAASKRLKRLRSLTLGTDWSGPLGEAGGKALAEAEWMPRLRSLALSYHRLEDAGVQALVSSPSVATLEHLELTHTGDTGGGFSSVAASPYLANLKELIWSGNLLPSEPISLLSESRFLNVLVELNLAHCTEESSSDDKMVRLSKIPFTRLERLDFTSNPIDMNAAERLAAAPWLKNLRQLILLGTELGDSELSKLAECNFLNLELLNLDINRFGEPGIVALANGTPWPKLKKLSLAFDTSLQHPPAVGIVKALVNSRRFPNLVELELRDVPIGLDGAAVLARSSLPSLIRANVSERMVGSKGKEILINRFGVSDNTKGVSFS